MTPVQQAEVFQGIRGGEVDPSLGHPPSTEGIAALAVADVVTHSRVSLDAARSSRYWGFGRVVDALLQKDLPR